MAAVVRSRVDTIRLEAVAAAKRLQRDLELQRRVEEQGGAIDIFAIIGDLDIPLIFKPLESAQGLCIPKPLLGIMITTQRTLNIQRFTAAHELGHAILEHGLSIDKQVLERGPLGPSKGRNYDEIAADAFAAEFLLPRWLYVSHIKRQGWNINHLRNPDIVYQLSLRLGASYEATCWGLLSNQILGRPDVEMLRRSRVASVKARLGMGHRPSHSWANVWRITERDDGSTLNTTEDDLLQLELREHASRGFEWDIDNLQVAGLEVLADCSDFDRQEIKYGAQALRRIVLRPTSSQRRRVFLAELQPWNAENMDGRLILTLALDCEERGGFSRAERERRGLVAS